jgi:hypothetical protein
MSWQNSLIPMANVLNDGSSSSESKAASSTSRMMGRHDLFAVNWREDDDRGPSAD